MTRTPSRAPAWLGLTLAALCGAAAPAHGQPARKRAPAAAITGPLALLGDRDLDVAARAAAALAGFPEAHGELVGALAGGLPATLAVAVLDAVAAHPAPGDVAVVVRYAGHRNPVVRGAALGALARFADPAARGAIAGGLHDPTAAVRAAAATAAVHGRVREAIDPLLQLLARGEEPAARALAALADPALAGQIAGRYGKVPDATLALCLGQILVRADFGPDPARTDVIDALAQIQDPAALSALTDYLDAAPKTPPRPSRKAAEKAINDRLGGGK